MKRLLQTTGLLLPILPILWIICRSSDPAPVAPADSSRRPEPFRDPSLVIRSEPLDPAARAQGESLLRRMRSKWKSDYEFSLKNPGCGYVPPGRFNGEWSSRHTEVRLFSLGYPELAEAWATSALELPNAPHWDRYNALLALATLWEAGRTSAGATLAREIGRAHV